MGLIRLFKNEAVLFRWWGLQPEKILEYIFGMLLKSFSNYPKHALKCTGNCIHQ